MKLQILIVAYGMDDGIRELHRHPAIEGVEYLVSWQHPDMARLPKTLVERSDFKIFPTDTIGISRNRNEAFRHATGDFVLLSDADLIYTPEHLRSVIEGFESHPDREFLTFEYESSHWPKRYPDRAFNFERKAPKGYYITSFEIGFNLKRIRQTKGTLQDLRFNTNFGINGDVREFGSGEEELLIASLLRKGYRGRFLPSVIAEHPGNTTGMRECAEPDFVATKGACLSHIRPLTWPLRLLVHAWRAHRQSPPSRMNFYDYCHNWLRGVRIAGRNKVFK